MSEVLFLGVQESLCVLLAKGWTPAEELKSIRWWTGLGRTWAQAKWSVPCWYENGPHLYSVLTYSKADDTPGIVVRTDTEDKSVFLQSRIPPGTETFLKQQGRYSNAFMLLSS